MNSYNKKKWRIFSEAIELPLEERALFLASICGKDATLRRDIDKLLNVLTSEFIKNRPVKQTTDIDSSAQPFADAGNRIGRFVVIKLLGTGGMGTVLKAHDPTLDRDVALKLITKGALASPELKRRFFTEAQAVAQLKHKNICAIYNIIEDADLPYLVLEYVEGKPLNVLLQDTNLGIQDTIKYALQIAEGLLTAHTKSIVHRDIKPSNIIITTSGDAVILDFGIAKMLNQPTQTEEGQNPGTPAYMPPEQIEGSKVDRRSDIWSLGSVLFEMLSGEKYSNIKAGLTHSLRKRHPKLTQVLTKALTDDPKDRYQSAQELIDDLNIVLRSLEKTSQRQALLRKLIPALTVACILFFLIQIYPWPVPLPPPVQTEIDTTSNLESSDDPTNEAADSTQKYTPVPPPKPPQITYSTFLFKISDDLDKSNLELIVDDKPVMLVYGQHDGNIASASIPQSQDQVNIVTKEKGRILRNIRMSVQSDTTLLFSLP